MDIIVKTIFEIQEHLNLSDSEMASLMGTVAPKYRLIRQLRREPLLKDIQQLSRGLSIHQLNILMGDIDFETLKAHRQGDKFSIPKRYTSSGGSKMRTIRKLINPLELYYGKDFSKMILLRFQLTEEFAANDEQEFNVRLIHDIFKFLKEEWAITAEMFFCIGQNSHCKKRDKSLFDFFNGITSLKKMHEKIFEELTPHYEKNYDYKILKIGERAAIVDCQAKPERCEEFRSYDISNLESCSYREGVISGLATLIGYSKSDVNILRSVHEGDRSTVYEIQFNSNKLPMEPMVH